VTPVTSTGTTSASASVTTVTSGDWLTGSAISDATPTANAGTRRIGGSSGGFYPSSVLDSANAPVGVPGTYSLGLTCGTCTAMNIKTLPLKPG
jgi:hypothetical protein